MHLLDKQLTALEVIISVKYYFQEKQLFLTFYTDMNDNVSLHFFDHHKYSEMRSRLDINNATNHDLKHPEKL